MADPDQDFIDDNCIFEDDEEEDMEAECGRWDQNAKGGLSPQCRLAGTEWCDWECPIGLSRK